VSEREVSRAAEGDPARELAALLALPATWKGCEPAAIATSMLDALVSLLRLDIAYLDLDDGRVERTWPPATGFPPELAEVMRARIEDGDIAPILTTPDPARDGAFRVAGLALKPLGHAGLIAVGSRRPTFPNPFESFLLSMATEQALIAIDTALLIAREQRRARQLRALTEAAADINAAVSTTEALQRITDRARDIIGAHQAMTSLSVDQAAASGITTVSFSSKYERYRSTTVDGSRSGLSALVCRENRPYRLTHEELLSHPAWRGGDHGDQERPPLRGWLAAPLIGRDGENLGLIELSDRNRGDFTENDEAILVQLAHLASVAIQNTHLYEQARRALSLRDEFLAQAAHELKSPLTALKGYVQLSARRGGADPFSARMVTQVNRLDRLVGDLISVVRLETGQLELVLQETDLITVAESCIGAAQALSVRHVISLERAPASLVGRWDPDRLTQVFENLLANAVKYSPGGGEIRVQIRMVRAEVRVSVHDAGAGIAADVLPRLFERFYRAPSVAREVDGLGLGLTITRSIIEGHGGRIWAESAGEQRGSTFAFTLPLNRLHTRTGEYSG
jgi:signal transduction histidine kinase